MAEALAQVGSGRSCYCTAVRKASRRVSQLYDLALAPSGLKSTQRAILAQLKRSGPATVGALGEALVVESSGLVRALKPLTRDKLVAVGINPVDRRSRLISLTPAGYAKLKKSAALWEAAQRNFESAFGQARSKALRETMELLVSATFTEVV